MRHALDVYVARGGACRFFVAGGTRDEKSPIESAGVFVLEMLRDRRRALRYLILPDLDHSYVDGAGREHTADVLGAFLDWALAPRKDRSVLLGLGAR
jgi:dipeptidyl aminopeptidase/acylaminoacyl peptidase